MVKRIRGALRAAERVRPANRFTADDVVVRAVILLYLDLDWGDIRTRRPRLVLNGTLRGGQLCCTRKMICLAVLTLHLYFVLATP